MEPDNTLGAPTEGLGQTPTFVPQVAQDVSIGGAGDPGRSRAQVLGGFGPGVKPAQFMASDTGSPTMRFIAKTIARTGEAYSKEAQTKDFLTGVQRAMAGEAVEDIATEQPWYSKIFGDSDVVAGARAYRQEKNVQDLMITLDQKMPDLVRLSAEDANQFYVDTLKKSMTGHTATDAAITSSFMRSIGTFEKTRSKGQYEFMQNEAATAKSAAQLAAADRIQTAADNVRNGLLSPEDFEAQTVAAASIGEPDLGSNFVSWQTRTTKLLGLMAEKGQFHALNAYEKIGYVKHLTPEQQAQYTRNREANEAQHRVKFGAQYIEKLQALKNLAERGPEGWRGPDTVTYAKSINATYREQFGVNNDLIPPDIVASYGERTDQAIAAVHAHNDASLARQANAHAQALDKASAKALQLTAATEFYRAGRSAAMGQLTELSDTDRHTVAMSVVGPALQAPWAKEAGPAFDALVANAAGDKIDPILKQEFVRVANSGAISGAPTPLFATGYEQWRQISMRNPEAAVTVYGDELNSRYAKFKLMHPESLGSGGIASSTAMTAFATSFGVGSSKNFKTFDKKEEAVWVTAAVGKLSSWMPGTVSIRPGQTRHASDLLKNYAMVHGETHPPQVAGELAVASFKRDGGHVVGGYLWQDTRIPDFRKHVQEVINAPGGSAKVTIPEGNEFDQYFSESVDSVAKAAGINDEPILRAETDRLVLTGRDRNNGIVLTVLPYQTVANEVRAKTLLQRSKAASRTLEGSVKEKVAAQQWASKAVTSAVTSTGTPHTKQPQGK